MEPPFLNPISVTRPVNPAIERANLILFRPFSLDKWICIGFCAWLADLGQRGGGSFSHNSNYSPSSGNGGGSSSNNLPFDVSQVRDYLHHNIGWIIPVAIGVLVLALAIGVLIAWLQSRGTFMLLHCVALDRGEVAVPWRKFAREAHSLWLFKLALGLIALLFILPILGAAGVTLFDMFYFQAKFDTGKIPLFVALGVAWVCLFLPFSIVGAFTRHFAAPIMYLRGGTCMQAWRELMKLISSHVWEFILYILFQFVIGIATGILVLAFGLCTCCIGFLLLVIPYVGAVVLLPITVFQRSYSLYYLAQYGEKYDVFAASRQPPPLTP
jgi:hypothetical protein